MLTNIQGRSEIRTENQRVGDGSSGDATAAFRAALLAATGGGAAKSAASGTAVQGAGGTTSPAASLPIDLLQSEPTAADSRIADFRAWKTDYFKHGIGDDRRQQVEDSSAAFEAVLTKAASCGGLEDPKAFLQSLSPSELKAVQTIQCLANPIQVGSLSQEGASNLLRAPDQAQDLDHDGFEEVGAAKTSHFPPPDAPASVKQAWKEATANLSDGDLMLLSGSFLVGSLPEAGGGNAYLGPDADYAGLVQRTIDGAKLSSKYDQSWQHETRTRQIDLLQSFLDRLGTA
ncbi:hypothetical protein [Paramagnetospirillum magneticum]|nr:hypothetical protein [Paramagnetospirillum magneticum]